MTKIPTQLHLEDLADSERASTRLNRAEETPSSQGNLARPKLKGPITKEWLLKFRNICPSKGCWLWTRSRGGSNKQYGKSNGRYVHRVAFELWIGPIPKGYEVCHHCDVPLCFNPVHLFVGTQLDNIRDQISKNRKLVGLRCPVAKLNREIVIEIRNAPESCQRLAKRFGLCAQTIWNVKNRVCYKDVE